MLCRRRSPSLLPLSPQVSRSGYRRSSTQGRKSKLMGSRDSQGPMAEPRAGQGPQPLPWSSLLYCSRLFQSVLCSSALFCTLPHSSTLFHTVSSVPQGPKPGFLPNCAPQFSGIFQLPKRFVEPFCLYG